MELYPFQEAAKAKTYERLQQGHRPIVCSPTGSGKTVIAASMANDFLADAKRVLWMTGREEIIRQAYRTFVEICGIKNVGVLCAGLRGEAPWWHYPPVTLASWDTLKARWDKSPSWRIPADAVLYDEAHLCLSTKMRSTVIPYYENKPCIGFTATPSRSNGMGLGRFFTRIIQVRRVKDIIADGYLAAPEYWAGSHADTSKIASDARSGDFKQSDLSSAHDNKTLIGDVVDNWLRIASDRRTIVFAVDIAHAQALTEKFQAAGAAAACIHSKLSGKARLQISDQFRHGDVQVLVNVGIATYGYDVPEIRCVVAARPTQSIVLWHQMVGRGLRRKPDGDHCKVLDHGDNIRRLGCIEDDIRWKLDDTVRAATNVTREGDPSRNRKPESPPTTCDNCKHVFSRSRICPACGWEKPPTPKDVETVDADLVRIRSAQSDEQAERTERERWYRMALGWCDEKGKKRGFAYHRYREKFKDKPPLPTSSTPLQPDRRIDAYMRAGLIRFAKRRGNAKARATV